MGMGVWVFSGLLGVATQLLMVPWVGHWWIVAFELPYGGSIAGWLGQLGVEQLTSSWSVVAKLAPQYLVACTGGVILGARYSHRARPFAVTAAVAMIVCSFAAGPTHVWAGGMAQSTLLLWSLGNVIQALIGVHIGDWLHGAAPSPDPTEERGRPIAHLMIAVLAIGLVEQGARTAEGVSTSYASVSLALACAALMVAVAFGARPARLRPGRVKGPAIRTTDTDPVELVPL